MKILKPCLLSILSLCCLNTAVFGSKVLIIHSYHADYSWCEKLDAPIKEMLSGADIDTQFFYMDTKRKPGNEWKLESASQAKELLASYQPDVVITVDDNAQSFVAKELVGAGTTKIVFTGVNADPEAYGFPADNATGILERTYADQSLGLLQQIIPFVERVAYITDDSATANLVTPRIKHSASEGELPIEISEFKQIGTMSDWEKAIEAMNADDSIGALLIPLYHTIKDASGETITPSEVMAWTVEHSQKPVVGLWPFSTDDGALAAVVVDPAEHGRVAAQMAIDIVGGKSPSEIPMVENQEGFVIINAKTAQRLGIEIPFEIISSANQIIE